MANIIDSLVVLLGLDNSNFKKNAAESEKIQQKIQDNTTKQTKQQTETGKKTADLQARQSKDAVKNNNAQADSFKAMAGQALALYGVFKTAQGIYGQFAGTLARNTDIAFASENLQLSGNALEAWMTMAEKAGSTAGEMAAQLQKAQMQVGQQPIGQLDKAGQNVEIYAGYVGLDGQAAFKDAESLLKMKADIIKRFVDKQGVAKAQFYAQGMDVTGGSFNVMKGGGDAMMAAVEAAKKLNTITPGDLADAKALKAAQEDLAAATRQLYTGMMVDFLPAIQALADGVKLLTAGFKQLHNLGVDIGKSDKTAAAVEINNAVGAKLGGYIAKTGELAGAIHEGIVNAWDRSGKAEREGQLSTLLDKYIKKEGLDPAAKPFLTGIAHVEDATLDPKAQSAPDGKGRRAVGVYQIRPTTGKTWGISDADRTDFEKNVAAAVHGFLLNYKTLGSFPKAALAHKTGPTGVQNLGEDWKNQSYLRKVYAAGGMGQPNITMAIQTVNIPNATDAAGTVKGLKDYAINNPLTTQIASGMGG